MTAFTIIVKNANDEATDVREYDNERGAKGAFTRLMNRHEADGHAVTADLVDEDGFTHDTRNTSAYDAEREAQDVVTEDEAESIDRERLVADLQPERASNAPEDHYAAGTSPKGQRLWKVIPHDGSPKASFGYVEAALAYIETIGDASLFFGDLNAPKTCRCGCGETTKGGFYVPGHDRRHYVLADKAMAGDQDALERIAKAGIPPLFGQVKGTYDPEVQCDAACEFAASDKCSCSCGGENHRAGWFALEALLDAAGLLQTA